MGQEKYTLHWHTYSDHLRDILKKMSSDDSFADVTLVTDDRKQIKAHRNILSSCSSVFKEILQINSDNSHPVIYLRGIQHSEMESILQFIYLGEAKFYEGRMHEFLNVAKNLDIRELVKGNEDGDETTAVNEDKTGIDSEDTPMATEDVGEQRKLDIDESASGQHKTQSGVVTKGYKYECQQCNKAFTKTSNLTRHIQSIHEGMKYACNQCDLQFTTQSRAMTKGYKYECQQCDKAYITSSHLTRHIQSVHEGVNVACDQCDKQYTDQSSLTRHIQSVHEGVKYACNHCDKCYTDQSALTKHFQSAHEGIKYACDQCDKEYTEQGGLTRHIQINRIEEMRACHLRNIDGC